MPLMKIPDSVLENLRCQQCGRYLSKAPVHIQDGKSVCSDCIDTQNPTSVVVSQNSQYEALASLFAFPCRYKLQGCLNYVEFNKLGDHEAVCFCHLYECPVNLHSPIKCNWKGPTMQLYRHYETQHPELYLQADSPKFKINLEDHEVYRLIKVEGVLLLLQTKCSLRNDKVWFNMVCFQQGDSVGLINYVVKLSGSNGRIVQLEIRNPLPITKIQMIPSLSLDENIHTLKSVFKQSDSDYIECQWDINITEELKLKIKTRRALEEALYKARNEDIKCPHCGFYMVPPIYRCYEGHKTCGDCKGYQKECKTCRKCFVQFAVAEDLENIAKSGPHYCRWIKCQEMVTCDELAEHERTCPHRIYKCPQCKRRTGTLQQLVEHFKLVHPEIIVSVTPSPRVEANNSNLRYVIAHNEIFKVEFNVGNQLNAFGDNISKIDIQFLGSPRLVNSWNYEIAKNSRQIQPLTLQQIEYRACIEKYLIVNAIPANPYTFTISKKF